MPADDYTPTTEQVRRAYTTGMRHAFIASAGEHSDEFDRFLAAHDAQVRRDAAREALAQEPTDAEVEAAARALWAEVWIDPDEHPWDTEATRVERASCRREARAALSAARAARRDEEKQDG